MGDNKVKLTVRQLHNGNVRFESNDCLFMEEIAKTFGKWTGNHYKVEDTEVESGTCWYIVFDSGTVETAKDEATYVGDCFKVKIDLIEWFEDDLGQYEQTRGLPRSLDCVYVPLECKTDDEIGDYLLNTLEESHRIRPLLVSWNKMEEENNEGE